MRFGISATSVIVPKNFLTRLRPVNVCAIVSLSIRFGRATRAPLRTVAIHRDHQDRRRGCPYLCDSGSARTAAHFTPSREWVSAHALPNNSDRWPIPLPCFRQPRGDPSGLSGIPYLSSTLAPTFSRVVLILLASSLATPSLIVFGTPSTRSLASLRPRPVSARTSLITSIFFSPVEARTTVNSVFSAAGAGAPPAPAGPAATATAAAAETPHFSSSIFARSAASRTVRLDNSSTIFCRSAIFQVLIGSNQRIALWLSRSGALGGMSLDHARDLGRRSVDELRELRRRRLQQADDHAAQFVE